MPDPRDFLPQPPWEGPPIPRFFKEWYYIQSLPPKNYLYHHSYYSGLKGIAQTWSIRVDPGKMTMSLTTDPGRYLSPLPFLTTALGGLGVDGVVRIPYNEEMRRIAVPCLYKTREVELVERARAMGYNVFTEETLPVEYRYVRGWVTKNAMFVDENEYSVIGKYINLPSGSEVFVDPRKLKRLLSALGPYSMPVRSLKELAEELEKGIR